MRGTRHSATPRAGLAIRPGNPGRQGSIYVCSLAELSIHAKSLRPSHLVSLVPPHEQPPTPFCVQPAGHLRLELDDIEEPMPGHILPETDHVNALIEFARAWDGERPMLMHCAAGISRSMAAALAALCSRSNLSERQLADHLRQAAPHAKPNRRIARLADALLDRRGHLLEAVDAMGPAETVTRGPLVRLSVTLTRTW